MSCQDDCNKEYFADLDAADRWYTAEIKKCMKLPTEKERDACVNQATTYWQNLKLAAADKRDKCLIACGQSGSSPSASA